MKVSGKHTEISTVNVDIDPLDIIQNLFADIKPKYAEYLKDGIWYTEDGFDYHKREHDYKELQPATDEEIELYNALLIVHNYLLKNR